MRALRDGPGYTWVTSGQSPDAKKFFPAITAETGVTFTEYGSGCQHMTHDSDGRLPPPAGRPPKPVVEPDLRPPR